MKSIPSFDYTGNGRCSKGEIYCQRLGISSSSSHRCINDYWNWFCDGSKGCRSVSTQPEYQHIHDESYCDPTVGINY